MFCFLYIFCWLLYYSWHPLSRMCWYIKDFVPVLAHFTLFYSLWSGLMVYSQGMLCYILVNRAVTSLVRAVPSRKAQRRPPSRLSYSSCSSTSEGCGGGASPARWQNDAQRSSTSAQILAGLGYMTLSPEALWRHDGVSGRRGAGAKPGSVCTVWQRRILFDKRTSEARAEKRGKSQPYKRLCFMTGLPYLHRSALQALLGGVCPL